MNQALLFVSSALLVAASASASAPVDADQLAAWQSFFDATNGAKWTRCAGKRDSPCTCSGTGIALVECDTVDGTSFIKTVKLNSIGVTGSAYPVDQINQLIDGYEGFLTFDISGSTIKNKGNACLPIPGCNAGVSCKFDAKVCKDGTTPPPTVGGGGSNPPTASQVNQLQAWKRFYDKTGGPNWTQCINTRPDPCLCGRNQGDTAPIKVVCSGTVVTSISLVNNGLTADTFPTEEVNNLIAGGATSIVLTENPNLAPSATCFDAAQCATATCTFDKAVCGAVTQTPAPGSATASPSVGGNTNAPTSDETPTPTTGTPTTATTPQPTTLSPTTNVTPQPTTLAPTTESPTLRPTTSGTLTPTTLAPTGANTASPSGNTTPSPTLVNTPQPTTLAPTTGLTLAPTRPVGPVTLAPTGSFASPSQTMSHAAVLLLAAVMAFLF